MKSQEEMFASYMAEEWERYPNFNPFPTKEEENNEYLLRFWKHLSEKVATATGKKEKADAIKESLLHFGDIPEHIYEIEP